MYYLSWSFFIPGLSPDLQSMEQIRRIMRPTDVPDTGKNIEKVTSLTVHV